MKFDGFKFQKGDLISDKRQEEFLLVLEVRSQKHNDTADGYTVIEVHPARLEPWFLFSLTAHEKFFVVSENKQPRCHVF